MDGRPPVDAHLALIEEFQRRFPLFDRIVGRFGENASVERIPWFFGFILSAAANSESGACCFVLDKRPGTTALAAILAALLRLQQDFPSLTERYAQTALSRGQRVIARPGDFVYEYDGIWEDSPDFFKLKLIGEDAYRSFPLRDVLRLEPTDRVRPKGTGKSSLGTFERGPLDHLLGFTTCGNKSVIRNAVLLHMAQAQFARITDSITLEPEHTEQFDQLSSFLPWGSIGHDGALRSNDPHQLVGEPLIAATNLPEDLALASSSAEIATKAVFVDGVGGLVRNPQAFDSIIERQRMVILASPEETNKLDLLKDRGCSIWHMSSDEVLIGETSIHERTRTSLVGATIRAVDMRRHCKVSIIACRDEVLEEAAVSLERVARLSRDDEESVELDKILSNLFRILFECSGCFFGVDESIRSELHDTRRYIGQCARWLAAAVVKELGDVINVLENTVSNDTGKEKADALLNILIEHEGRWAVVTRSPQTAENLWRVLDGLDSDKHKLDLSILSLQDVKSDYMYDGVILPTWLNNQRFTRLRNLSVTTDIRVLAYPFESKWVKCHLLRECSRESSNQLDVEKRSSILNISPLLLSGLSDAKTETSNVREEEIVDDSPIFRLEERIASRRHITRPLSAGSDEEGRRAQLVQFFGDCHALLTEWAKLPVLNDLINGTKDDRVRHELASRLSMGDFVLFRDEGDKGKGINKELVRLIAEDKQLGIGEEEYRRIRDIAERWKSTLRHLGDDHVTIQKRLASHGVKRVPQTIAGWLSDPTVIGPKPYSVIEVIANTAEDMKLLSMKDEVINAISRIRREHQAAGVLLSKLILRELHGRLNELGDQPTRLDLGFGRAWVVQIESVEVEWQEYPVGQVNRLLWAADSAF